jgi:integrase
LDGHDPLETRIAARAVVVQQQADEAVNSKTFDECAEAYIVSHEAAWRNDKHVAQWRATLKTYVSPHFGQKRVSEIDVALVMKALEPIWLTKKETAKRVRGRIEAVLAWAAVRGFRAADNPARWKGCIDQLVPSHRRLGQKKHHAALPYTEIPTFMKALSGQAGVAAAALEFTILTASRTGEVLGAVWSEVNFETRTWNIPATRMKSGREHRVPLTQRVLNILREMEKVRRGDAVFPSTHPDKHLSNMAMLSVLKRMERTDLTAHGFRSTFRDWAAEKTSFQREVAEMALAHSIGNAVEAAYRRGDLFEKRRQLMIAWSEFCSQCNRVSVFPFAKEAQ